MPRETGRPDKIEDEELPQKNPRSGADRDASWSSRCEAYVQFIPELIPMVPTEDHDTHLIVVICTYPTHASSLIWSTTSLGQAACRRLTDSDAFVALFPETEISMCHAGRVHEAPDVGSERAGPLAST